MIPDDVRGVIALQHGRLGDAERRVLEVASVAGLEFSAAAIAAGAGAEVAEVEAMCAALARRAAFLDAMPPASNSIQPRGGRPADVPGGGHAAHRWGKL